MAYTLLMSTIVIVSFGLMFALVQFSETIITREKPMELAVDDGKAPTRNG